MNHTDADNDYEVILASLGELINLTCSLDISSWTSIFAQQLNPTFHWTLNDLPIDDRFNVWFNDQTNLTNINADDNSWTILTNQAKFFLKNLTDFGLVQCWLSYNDTEQRSYTSRSCRFLIKPNEHRNNVQIINSSFFSASIDNDKNDSIEEEKENDNEEEFISSNHRCKMQISTKIELIEFYCSILGNYKLISLNFFFKLN